MGGNANSSAIVLGVPNASVTSTASGGTGGSSNTSAGGAGGNANAQAIGVALQAVNISAVATGGNGGSNFVAGNTLPPAASGNGGSATLTGSVGPAVFGISINGGTVTVQGTAIGGNGGGASGRAGMGGQQLPPLTSRTEDPRSRRQLAERATSLVILALLLAGRRQRRRFRARFKAVLQPPLPRRRAARIGSI